MAKDKKTNHRVDENMAGEFGATGLVQKGFNAMGITFKGTAREAYAILVAYFRDTTGNINAAQPLNTIGVALNSVINKQKNKVDVNGEGAYAQSVGGASFNTALDLAGTRGMMKYAGKKAATTAAARGAGAIGKALAGPVGWGLLAADVINDAINIVNACKNRKNPTLAPMKALDTLNKFFRHRGKRANSKNVQTALRTLYNMVSADARKQNMKPVQGRNTAQNRQPVQNNRMNTSIPAGQERSSYNIARQRNMNNRMVAESGSRGNIILLTEEDLHRIVSESVTETLNEFGIIGALTGGWAVKKFLKSKLGKQLLNIARKEGVPALEKLAKTNKTVARALENKTIRKWLYGEAAEAAGKGVSKEAWGDAAKGFTSTTTTGQAVDWAGKEAAGNAGKLSTKGKVAAGAAGGYAASKIGGEKEGAKNRGGKLGPLGKIAVGVGGAYGLYKGAKALRGRNGNQDARGNQATAGTTDAQQGEWNNNGSQPVGTGQQGTQQGMQQNGTGSWDTRGEVPVYKGRSHYHGDATRTDNIPQSW